MAKTVILKIISPPKKESKYEDYSSYNLLMYQVKYMSTDFVGIYAY